MRNTPRLLLCLLLAAILLTACAPAAAPAAGGATDGKSLVASKCSTCHAVNVVQSQKLTQAQWSDLVLRMVGHGLVVTDAEQKTIVNYLAETYK